MNRAALILLGAAAILYLLLSRAPARHLLHDVPADVAKDISETCAQLWPNSAFQAGFCADQRAAEWLQAKANGGRPQMKDSSPDLLVRPPDIIVRPEPDEDSK